MNPRLSLLTALALAAAGCAVKAGKPEAQKSQAERPFAFPHGTHKDAEVACVECHVGIDRATKLEANVRHVQLPTKSKTCAACHDPIPKAPPPRKYEPAALNYSHAAHLPRVKGDCTQCHLELTETGMAKSPVPPMSACTACHNHAKDYAEARCMPCHLDLRRYPLKPVSDFSHQGDFLRTHGAMARQRAETCATCHDQTKCAECHAATTRPFKAEIQFPEEVESRFVHRGDFLSRHPIEAAADPASCRRCHGSGYCRSCHEFQGVAPGVAGGRNPHPSSFFAQHGSAARQNIVACAGCHDQGAAAICVQCHRPGGIGGNPHPPGWAGKHSPSDVSKNRMCRACHS